MYSHSGEADNKREEKSKDDATLSPNKMPKKLQLHINTKAQSHHHIKQHKSR